jgi:malate dehydrogenase (oxaloacetate-decarboxylating)
MKSRSKLPENHTSASYTITLRLSIPDRPGMFARIANVIGRVGGSLGAVDLVATQNGVKIRDVTLQVQDVEHGKRVIAEVRKISGVDLINVSDRVFLMHLGGKISIRNKVPLTTRETLSMVYTPGVARVCLAIAEDPIKSHSLTIRKNTVAVVSDGSAVLGLGNIGPEGAMPVMEGKAMLFKEFGGVDAFPICLATQETEEIIRAVKWLAPTFGGINLEDISAPRCFEVEERLRAEMDIPVFHDDQHGTAVVVLAGLINACRLIKRKMSELRVVVIGVGAAGVACIKIMRNAGVREIIGCDRSGAIYKGRTENMNPWKEWVAENTNSRRVRGSVAKALEGADVFLGLSGPGLVKARDLKKMRKGGIVFALANPTPEIMPEEAQPFARIIATGRSDYPNQINNVLAFPGIFRGALDSRATAINEAMKLAAARAIASAIDPGDVSEEYIIPSVFDRGVGKLVAAAVARAAVESGVTRRKRSRSLVNLG